MKRPLPAVLVVVAMALAGLAFKPAVQANLVPKNFGVVDEGKVYRAGQLSPAQFRAVKERCGLRTIVDLGSFEPGTPGERRNQRTADALGLPRYVFDLQGDATGNPNAYAQALRIMTDPARQPVLVHCGAGSERTGCAAILYNTLVHGTPVEEGLAEARRFKHDPARNPRLESVLRQYADPILRAAREGGQVPGVPPLPPPEPRPPARARD